MSLFTCLSTGYKDQENLAREILGTLPDRWGRMDTMSKVALVGVGQVLRDTGMLAIDSPVLKSGWNGGLIVGSRRGSLAVDLEYAQTLQAGPGMASPHLFSYTLPNIPLAEAAIQYRLTGPVFVMIGEVPFEKAVLEARQWLEIMEGEKNIIVAGALDVQPSDQKSSTLAQFTLIKHH